MGRGRGERTCPCMPPLRALSKNHEPMEGRKNTIVIEPWMYRRKMAPALVAMRSVSKSHWLGLG